ncbi:MAG: nitrogenase-stabilizing/protective protein NifW [Rhodospirillales bacterium]
MINLPNSVKELDTAEAFLDHFGIAYDEAVVRRSRLHILQRFHDYLRTTEADLANDTDPVRDCLARAYDDFVRSDPLTERVFKVLRDAKASSSAPAGRIFIPLDAITGTGLPPRSDNGS